MADVADLVARIRSHGANVQMENGRLRVINQDKLPAGAMDFVKRHGKAVADWIEQEGKSAGGGRRRAPISASSADDLSRLLYENTPEGVDAADWTWFVSLASRILDDHLVAAA